MARAARKKKAEDLLLLYRELAQDLNPVVIHSTIGTRRWRAALAAMASRDSRIIVCVDMLGEGFDLPNLKVAALHEPHKSIGVSLQLIGRFARTSERDLGTATVVAARPDSMMDANLRRLYAEDADWNYVVQDLAEGAVGQQQELSDFEQGFTSVPADVAFHSVIPKNEHHCVCTAQTSTPGTRWESYPYTPEDRLLTVPIAVNPTRERVLWFITGGENSGRMGRSTRSRRGNPRPICDLLE